MRAVSILVSVTLPFGFANGLRLNPKTGRPEYQAREGMNLAHADQRAMTAIRNTTFGYKEKLWALLTSYQFQYMDNVEEHPTVSPIRNQIANLLWNYYSEVDKYTKMPEWVIPSQEHIAMQRMRKNSFWSEKLCNEKQLMNVAGDEMGKNQNWWNEKFGVFQNAGQCKLCVQKNCADSLNGMNVRHLAGHRSDHCDLAAQMCEDCNQGGHGCLGSNDLYAKIPEGVVVPKEIQLQWIKDEFSWVQNPSTGAKLLLDDPSIPIKIAVDYLIPDTIIP